MGGPPHWGKVFKLMCSANIGTEVEFEGEVFIKIHDISAEDSAYFKVGQEYAFDIQPVQPKPGKGK